MDDKSLRNDAEVEWTNDLESMMSSFCFIVSYD